MVHKNKIQTEGELVEKQTLKTVKIQSNKTHF